MKRPLTVNGGEERGTLDIERKGRGEKILIATPRQRRSNHSRNICVPRQGKKRRLLRIEKRKSEGDAYQN